MDFFPLFFFVLQLFSNCSKSKMHAGSSNFWDNPIKVLKLKKQLSRSFDYCHRTQEIQNPPHQRQHMTWPCHSGSCTLGPANFSKKNPTPFLCHSQSLHLPPVKSDAYRWLGCIAVPFQQGLARAEAARRGRGRALWTASSPRGRSCTRLRADPAASRAPRSRRWPPSPCSGAPPG